MRLQEYAKGLKRTFVKFLSQKAQHFSIIKGTETQTETGEDTEPTERHRTQLRTTQSQQIQWQLVDVKLKQSLPRIRN